MAMELVFLRLANVSRDVFFSSLSKGEDKVNLKGTGIYMQTGYHESNIAHWLAREPHIAYGD